MIRPLRRTYVVVVRKSDELLCGEYKWVSQFEVPCICTHAGGASRPANKFVDGSPRLAARVREVDGVDSFLPSLLLLLL